MASMTLYVHGTFVGDDGVTHPFGDPAVPSVATLSSGLVFVRQVEVAQNTTKVLFNTTNDLTSFSRMVITSDQDVYLELSTDIGNDVGDENFTLKVAAGVPFVLGSDDSYANYTVNFGGGTADNIERIRVRNLNSTTANVTVIAGV